MLARVGAHAGAARSGRAGAGAGPAEVEREMLEAVGARAAAPKSAGPAALRAETVKAILAFGVDLAAVEFRALVLVAQDLIGGIGLGELVLRLRVFLIAIGMVLLGEAAKRLLDLR